MKIPTILILFQIFTTEQHTPKTPGFLFSTPKILTAGTNETVCLSLHHATLPARTIIDLKIKEKHFFTSRNLDTEHSCFDLHVPMQNSLEPQLINIRVQVQLNGVVYSSHNQDPVLIYPNTPSIFIETDRSVYKPGDSVKLRILSLNQKFLPSGSVHIVNIRNPFDVTVVVWENITTNSGLIQLEHQLEQEDVVGKWWVDVDGVGGRYFEVTRYVLPRFKVELLYPKLVYKGLNIRVCAFYSYGRPVKGTAFIRLTDSHNNITPLQTIKEVKNGCADFSFTSSDLSLERIKDTFTMYDPKIQILITATITEYGTDKIELKTGKTLISFKAYHLKFECENTFLPGFPYSGTVQLYNINTGFNREVIEICYNLAVKKSWNLNMEQCSNVTLTSKQTSITFHILPLKHHVIHLHLKVRSLNHTNIGDSFLVVRLYSPSNSYIHLKPLETSCGKPQQFLVEYNTEKMLQNQFLMFYYMIKIKGHIYKLRKFNHNVRSQGQHLNFTNIIGGRHKFLKFAPSSLDKFVLKFKLDDQIVSKYEMLVYYITNTSETVASTLEINMKELCLNNKVTAVWSKKEAYPGSKATLSINTNSDSLCSISAVDKSTSFFRNSYSLSVNSLLKTENTEESPQSGRRACLPPKRHRESSALIQTDDFDLKRRKKRYVYSFSEDFDAYDIFNKFGTVIITNLKIITKTCYTGPISATNNPVQYLTEKYDDLNEDKIAQIRSYFPETWLWELVPVREAVTMKLDRNLPHTVTNWITNILCVSADKGVGFASNLEISGFQPFFIDVLTPYSMKRKEILYLHVVLFNYLNYSLPMRVTLRESNGLKLVDPLGRRSLSFCILQSASITHIFEIKAMDIGRMNITVLAEIDSAYPGQCGPDILINKRDVVFKSLLVEPEGFSVKNTKSALLCNKDTVTWNLEIPSGIVSNTDKVSIIINGDLLGSTIENLEELLEMPTGCGEQIMSNLAPNLYVLHYLKATHILTSSVRHRIIRNLKIGYQRILNYIHKDGSFSAFGYHDPSGSTFLTAFVIRVLQQAKQFVYVDQRIIDKAVSWLLQQQLENGCFSTMYHVFQDMGGTTIENSTAALTSYVMISLMEANISITESVKTNAKYCIRGHYHLDKYTLAISSYALFKVDWFSEADRMLKKLLQISNQQEDLLWWSNRDSNSLATDIEITSYVLLSLLFYNTNDNLAKAHSVVRWLSSKNGPTGGFKSTQDTVVALDALSKYANYINSNKLNLDISVSALNQKLKIRNEDRLKSKKIQLKERKDKIVVKVEGEGCILAQLIESFYLRQLPFKDAFKLDLKVSSVSTIDQCSIASISSCLAYAGQDQQANMAVLEVNLPSGYQADRASLYKLIEPESKMKMFEEIQDKVVFYFTKLDKQSTCINFNINENVIVKSRSNAIIKLYDYYKPEYEVLQFFKMHEKCTKSNFTMPEIFNKTSQRQRRDISTFVNGNQVYNELNPNFTNVDMELATPEGIEGPFPVYVKYNSTRQKYIDLNYLDFNNTNN